VPIIDRIDQQSVTEGSLPPSSLAGSNAGEASLFRRCVGHCCTCIQLMGGLSMKDLQENLRRMRTGGPWPQELEHGCRLGPLYPGPIMIEADLVTTIDMLIQLPGLHEEGPLTPPTYRQHTGRAPIPWFTCRHLIRGACAIYTRRPQFCRTFGGSSCEYRQCQQERGCPAAGAMDAIAAGLVARLQVLLNQGLSVEDAADRLQRERQPAHIKERPERA
jgi:Fe-S-cluster containining protein